jgi:hypothetical protein
MPQVQAAASRAVEGLQPVDEYARLTVVVRTLAREIERLNEDNQQLRAAIGVYREAVRLLRNSPPARLPANNRSPKNQRAKASR